MAGFDKEIVGVLLSFVLYVLYFLIPLIPSILIYKIFPETKVAASGSFSGLKVNSSGAFAAYLVTLVVSINALSDVQARILEIKNPIEPTWTIVGELELRDAEGNVVNQPRLFDVLEVSITPEIFSNANGDIHFKIPGTTGETMPERMITLDIKGFGRGKINLTADTTLDSTSVSVNYETKTISFKDPIIIKTLNTPGQQYTKNDYMKPSSGK